MWIKFCGMVRKEDVEAAKSLGVDAVGFIFVPTSPRVIKLDDIQYLKEFSDVQTVAVFQNPAMREVKAVDRGQKRHCSAFSGYIAACRRQFDSLSLGSLTLL